MVRFSASVTLVDFEPDNIFDFSIIEPDVITLNSGNSQIERIEEEPDYDPYDHQERLRVGGFRPGC